MSTYRERSRNRGFSLIEVMIYIAVTVSVSLAGVQTYLSLTTVLARHETERIIDHAAQVSLEKISRDIRAAESVDAAQSTLGTSPGELTLDMGATTTNFSIVGDALIYSRNGVEIGPLTSSGVVVEAFSVNRYVGTSTELVRVALTLGAHTKSASSTRTYYTSAVLRGSYE